MASYNPNNLSPDELSCPICFEEFSNLSSSENAPKLLLCLHTFCLGCIRSLVRSNKTIQCSICRTEHTDVSPQELFDNYVIMEYVRRQQEESDARLARQHSEHFMMETPDQPGYQRRQGQLLLDAELARRYQEFYDKERTVAATAPSPPCSISAPTVRVVQQAEVLCTAKEALPSSSQPIVVASCSRAHRPAPLPPTYAFCRSTSASSSSPSTSSVVTLSSNTFSVSRSSSSDGLCSSRESSSSRLEEEEEFVDTVDTLEVDEEAAGIAGAAAAAAGAVAPEGDVLEASGSSSCTASALSPAYTDHSGFSHHDSNDSHRSDGHDTYDAGHHSGDDNFNEDEEDTGSVMDNNSYHDDDDDDNNGDGEDSDDMNSLHLGETFSEHIEDDPEEDNLEADDGQQGSDAEEDEDDQEDELFNNFNALEAIDDHSPEGPAAAPDCHDIYSNDDSCISISSTESYSALPNKVSRLGEQFNPMRRNFPLSVHSDLSGGDRDDLDGHTVHSDAAVDDNDSVSTITLNDSEDSTSNAVNKTYNTRSRAVNTKGRLNA